METLVDNSFPNEYLMALYTNKTPWYVDIVNYFACGAFPSDFCFQRKKKFLSNAMYYQWEDPILYKYCADQIVLRCAPVEKVESIFQYCHAKKISGHFCPTKTAAKVLQSGFY